MQKQQQPYTSKYNWNYINTETLQAAFLRRSLARAILGMFLRWGIGMGKYGDDKTCVSGDKREDYSFRFRYNALNPTAIPVSSPTTFF